MTLDSPLVIAIAGGVAGGVLTLLGGAMQWGLGEISNRFASARDRRAKLNPVLTELLVLRHHILIQPKTQDPVKTGIGLLSDEQRAQLGPVVIPPAARGPILTWLKTLMPSIDDTFARYEAAVKDIADVEPLSAYALRNQTVPFNGARRLIELVSQAPDADPEKMREAHEALIEELIPEIEEAVLALAEATGGRKRRRTVADLMKDAPLRDRDAAEIMQRIMARLFKILGIGQSAPP